LDTEVGKQIPSSRAAAGKHRMHNTKPELRIISNLRSWIGFDDFNQAVETVKKWWKLSKNCGNYS
jgi:hypothetical protein